MTKDKEIVKQAAHLRELIQKEATIVQSVSELSLRDEDIFQIEADLKASAIFLAYIHANRHDDQSSEVLEIKSHLDLGLAAQVPRPDRRKSPSRKDPVRDFFLLEAIDEMVKEIGYFDRERLREALLAFEPDIVLSTIDPKISGWKSNKGWLTWEGTERAGMTVTAKGRTRRFELLPRAKRRKEEIERGIHTFNQQYSLAG